MQNVVLIMCDQQLREHLGCYGSSYGVTPNLDRLAAEGVTFEHAYTACPTCTPARGAIFTGRTPHMCGAYSNDLPLYETIPRAFDTLTSWRSSTYRCENGPIRP